MTSIQEYAAERSARDPEFKAAYEIYMDSLDFIRSRRAEGLSPSQIHEIDRRIAARNAESPEFKAAYEADRGF